ncbi:hypothetical protein [Arthrobacter pigmenti]
MSDDENVAEPPDEDGQDSDPEERIDLTPEQKAAFRRTIADIQRQVVPKVKLPQSIFPKSTIKNIAVVSRVAGIQQSTIARVMPFLDTTSTGQKRFVAINSDFFRGLDLVQPNLNLVASQLIRNTDFSIAKSAAMAAAKFTERQNSWLKTLAPTFAAMRGAFYPPNLRPIEGLEFEDVEKVVMVDGIPLYGLPRMATAEALIRADGARKRRDILGRQWKTISTDCRTAIEDCTSEAVTPYVPFVLAALDALDAGHAVAAQALAGSLVDTILTSYFGRDRSKYMPDKNGQPATDAYEEFSVRQFIAFAPILQTYQKFFVTGGDKIPMTFSRHATAHTVSPRQFNRRNTIQGLMVACSLLYRLNEEARHVEPRE